MSLDLMVVILEIIYKKKRDGAYIINLDDYCDIETHWIALYVLNNDVTYFDSFGVEHISKQIKTFAGSKKHENKYFQNASI